MFEIALLSIKAKSAVGKILKMHYRKIHNPARGVVIKWHGDHSERKLVYGEVLHKKK